MKMKRFLSVMMATVLMALTLSTGLTVMAQNYTTNDDIESPEVTFTPEISRVHKFSIIYNYTIEWGDLDFKYVKKYKQVWDGTTHVLKEVLDEDTTGWEGGDTRTITITNNAASTVGIGFTAYFDEYSGTLADGIFTVQEKGERWVEPGTSLNITLKANKPTSANMGSGSCEGAGVIKLTMSQTKTEEAAE